MNVLFLTFSRVTSLEKKGIYPDLLREFCKKGNKVFVVSPTERSNKKSTYLIKGDGWQILKVKTGNLQKTNIIEKGISTILVETQFKIAIKRHFGNIKFDLVLYSTPPITMVNIIDFIKKRDGAYTYLLLKDIFPQNSIDLKMLTKSGLKGIIYKYFCKKEKKLYSISDKIGCMSQANCDYIMKHYHITQEKLEVCPNCVEPIDMRINQLEKSVLRRKHELPFAKKIFVYGGNLGRPQDVRFIVQCLKECADIKDVFFVICGSGTDRHFLEEYMDEQQPKHVKLFDEMAQKDYDEMVACCDVGLVFLDHRFTIPNFPSRILSYMQAGIPVLACTDKATDIGTIIVGNGFGWWCESDDATKFKILLLQTLEEDNKNIGNLGYEFLCKEYITEKAYNIIINSMHSR